jgi:hypothetical protein
VKVLCGLKLRFQQVSLVYDAANLNSSACGLVGFKFLWIKGSGWILGFRFLIVIRCLNFGFNVYGVVLV